MDLFQSVPDTVSVKNQNSVISNPVTFKNFEGDLTKADFIILSDGPMKSRSLSLLKRFFNEQKMRKNWAVVSSVIVPPEKLKSNIVDFYISNRTDLENVIPKKSKILSLGRAIYAITQTDDLMDSDFVDFITDKTSFYSPDLFSQVFPIPDTFKWMNTHDLRLLDNFEANWVVTQIVNALEYEFPKTRDRKNIHYIVDDVDKFFEDHKEPCLMALDTETDSLDWYTNRIGCVTIAFNDYEGYYLRWKDIDVDKFSDFLSNKDLLLSHAKFDVKSLVHSGCRRDAFKIKYDVWNMQHVWKEDNSHNSLKSGAWRHGRNGGYDRELDRYKKKQKIKNYLDIPEPILIPYATDDPIETFRVYQETRKLIELMDSKYPLNNGWSLWRYFEEVVMGAVNTFLKVELDGFYVNYKELLEISEEVDKEIQEIEKDIYKAFNKDPKDFNIHSQEQLSALIESLGWEIEERGKQNQPLTHEGCLTKWKNQGHREAELLLKLREKTALMNTFIGREKDQNGFFQYLRKEGSVYKIYPSILPMLADSGRSKHKDPNTANIPAWGQGAETVRRMFCPPSEDFVFLSADASGLQLRIGALLSRDPVMRDIFINQGGEMHSRTAFDSMGSIYYINDSDPSNIELSKIKKENFRPLTLEDFLRYRKTSQELSKLRLKGGKNVGFGYLFGAQASTFKKEIDKEWSKEDCDDFIISLNLEKEQKELFDKNYEKLLEKGIVKNKEEGVYWSKAMAISDYLRKKFFTTYQGLETWHKESRNFAKEHGFVRSIYGAFRRLPYLLYKGSDTDNKLYANLLNICLNSPVQNIESVQMNRMMTYVSELIEKNNLKSYFFAAVHDAIEMMVHKSEISFICKAIKDFFEEDRPEYEGIPFEMEGKINDYWGTYKTDNWELWDLKGTDWEEYLK